MQKVQIEEALNKERELSGLQRQFVAMVSHEFRTPLSIIDGHAQRILRRLDDMPKDRLEKALKTVRLSVHRLVDLMESVLSAARLENGQIQINPKPCSLTDLIQEVSHSYLDLHPDRRINLDLGGLPEEILADDKLVRQVISNIISNAIKYSPDATQIWVGGSIDEQGRATVSVRDEGLGIPLAEQTKLFERFFRASTSTGIAGTGIGLHLASLLVQMHGGIIDFMSVEGEGTTFSIRLPVSGTSPGA
jgi:signal transduction histidine kinase